MVSVGPVFGRARGDHPRAQEVLAVVKAAPGLSFRALARRTGIPHGSLRHHLTVLKRNRLLREERVAACLAYFPATYPEAAQIAALVDRAGLRDLLETVRELQPCRQMDVLDARSEVRSTVQHRLRRLVALGAVRVTRYPRSLRYEVVVA